MHQQETMELKSKKVIKSIVSIQVLSKKILKQTHAMILKVGLLNSSMEFKMKMSKIK